jgi:hypothetical protein
VRALFTSASAPEPPLASPSGFRFRLASCCPVKGCPPLRAWGSREDPCALDISLAKISWRLQSSDTTEESQVSQPPCKSPAQMTARLCLEVPRGVERCVEGCLEALLGSKRAPTAPVEQQDRSRRCRCISGASVWWICFSHMLILYYMYMC